MNKRKLAKRLSTDRPYEDLNKSMPFPNIGGRFILYANGTRWYLDCWVNWSLYWIPGSQKVESRPDNFLCYYCTWLPNKTHIKNIESVMWKHPNLTDWQWAWLPVWAIKLLWRLGFRFTKRVNNKS